MSKKYIIIYERMGGDWYYMIYRKGNIGVTFWE